MTKTGQLIMRYAWVAYFVALLASLGVMFSDWKLYTAISAMAVLVDLSGRAAR